MAPRLAEGIDVLGRGTGRNQRRERPGSIARRDPVVRELVGADGHPTDLPAPLEFPAKRRMQPVSLAVEQLPVRDLSQERVPEGVATKPVVDATGVDEDSLGD